MGKIKTLPYVKDVGLYFLQGAISFVALRWLFMQLGIENIVFILILALFLGFSINPYYAITLALLYAGFFFITQMIPSSFFLLIAAFLYTLLNTLALIVYLKLSKKMLKSKS